MAIGLGWQWVGSVMRERDSSTAAENSAVAATKLKGDIADLREKFAVLQAEFKMQGQLMLKLQRDNEELRAENAEMRREIVALKTSGIVINAGNDATFGGDIAGRDKTDAR